MKSFRIKTLFFYQLNSFKHVFLIMYLCITAIVIVSHISLFGMGENVVVCFDNIEIISLITLFVIALFSYRESFRFGMANSVTRKSHFASTVLSLGALSAAFSLANTLFSTVYGLFFRYMPIFVLVYGTRFGLTNRMKYDTSTVSLTFQMQLESFLWSTVLHFMLATAGFLIAALSYRMNKWMKIAFLVGVPTVLLNGIDALDYYVLNGKIRAFLLWFWALLFTGGNYINPYLSMLNMLLFSALLAALAWLPARRAALKRT